MSQYFDFVTAELLQKLKQVKAFVKKHNPTIGLLTEEILRDFLRTHLPKIVSVEQGFVIRKNGELSRQCDIIIYDSIFYAPFYRINDVVVVPEESVLAIVEVKTSITKRSFHEVIEYFADFKEFWYIKTYLFIFKSASISRLNDYFHNYKHPGAYQEFDHDTFQWLPDEITGVNPSFHLTKDAVITDQDQMGYTSYFFEGMDGSEISALENFFLSIYRTVEIYIEKNFRNRGVRNQGDMLQSDRRAMERSDYHSRQTKYFFAIPLFDM
ncbi:DUF6602 domain-containing protein [Paraburkholderia caribensis]|uniref:DUF6602 domain-containing protein n=1 Tax=Paraburkholderia caribensis TaxID=75105 RepID=UPI00078E9225|nr:DUF6602 domain-containing protein [Paraburkholderia caribensis]AMV42290.1 hypothetical protein ATN79_06305 [Paraburkholderia caribensis]